MSTDPANQPVSDRQGALPSDRSLWRTAVVDVSPRAPRPPLTPKQKARVWILVIGGLLAAFGAVSAIAGRVALVAAYDNVEGVTSTNYRFPGADTASAWMWTGIVTLILGFAILMIELFLSAHSRADVPSRDTSVSEG